MEIPKSLSPLFEPPTGYASTGDIEKNFFLSIERQIGTDNLKACFSQEKGSYTTPVTQSFVGRTPLVKKWRK